MVTGQEAPQDPNPVGRTRDGTQAGSAIVAALALALIVTVVAGSLTARSVGTVLGAAAEHDRVVARTVAERRLHTAMAAVDDLAITGPVTSMDLDVAALDLSAMLDGPADGPADVRTVLGEEHGDVTIVVEASVGGATATASARLRPRSTADVAWLAEYRTRDPMLEGLPRAACTWPIGDPRRHAGCRTMPLPSGPIGGPVHSNDTYPWDDAIASGRIVTTSVLDADGPAHRSELSLPRDPVLVMGGRPPTCRFRGPTLLRFDGPRVRVTSPLSVPRPGDTLDADSAIGCLGVDRATLAGIVDVELPAVAVIEVVADREGGCVGHPLGLGGSEDLERAWRCDAGDAFLWGRYEGARTVVAQDSIQVVWDLEPGDALAPRSLEHGDVLGLVAADSVVLRRPWGRVSSSSFGVVAHAGDGVAPFGAYPTDAPSAAPVAWTEPRMVASVATLGGSLAPQNGAYGDAWAFPITVVGSIGSRFAPATSWDLLNHRGRLVGTREFPLHLTYDDRLADRPPPAMPAIDGGRMRVVELGVG